MRYLAWFLMVGVGLLMIACTPREESATSYLSQGLRHHQRGYLDLARANYSRAIELDPDNALAYSQRGQAYYELKLYNWAIADFNRAIELKANYTEAYHRRGILYYDLGKSDRIHARLKQFATNIGQAIADFNWAIMLNPDLALELNSKLALAYYERGAFYLRDQGEQELAAVDLNKALDLNPGYANAYLARGLLYVQQEKQELADADINKALQLKSDYADAYLARGLLYRQQGKQQLAETDFAKALELNPELIIPD